tara:strand:- start:2460 stop:2666 length:207 start_codon:yes stop_codon:yes gene_type:complete
MKEVDAKLVLHLVYGDEQSASVAGHRMNGYATASISDSRWLESKDAFMGAVCNAFERMYDEMKEKDEA